MIRFNAFDMNCVAHQSPGLWKHPEDQSWRYKDIRYWTELAQLLERGRFDGLFIADVLGTYDVYGASDEAAIRQGAQIPVNDPMLLVSAMALVTEHLGFGITTGTGFEHPYPFARRMSTLDHLTNGRIGWNVVTGYLPAAARNMGQTDQPAHDARYDHADEYLEVLYKLWEGSWEDDAVVRDREKGIFTDPDKVHHIGHSGAHFSVPGVHLSEPSVQRTPVIYQAGASPRGVRFAAENAEAIFTGAPTKEILRETVSTIRRELELAGRDPYSAKIFNMTTIITGATDEEAHNKHLEYLAYGDPEGALVFMSGWMGIDLAQYGLDEPIGNVDSNAILSAVRAFQSADPKGGEWTVGDIAEWVRSAAWGRGSWARPSGSPTPCRNGSRRPTWTGSTSRTPSHRDRSPTSSSTWCRCSPSVGPTRPSTPRLAAQQADRGGRPAARRAPRCELPGGRAQLDGDRSSVDPAVLVGIAGGAASAGPLTVAFAPYVARIGRPPAPMTGD